MSTPTIGTVVVIDGVSYQVGEGGALQAIPEPEGGGVADGPFGGAAAAAHAKSVREYFTDEEWRRVFTFSEPQACHGDPMEAARTIRDLAAMAAHAKAAVDPEVLTKVHEETTAVADLTKAQADLADAKTANADLRLAIGGLEQEYADLDEKVQPLQEALAVADAVLDAIADMTLGEGVTADKIIEIFTANFDDDRLRTLFPDLVEVTNADGSTEIVQAAAESAPETDGE